MKKEYDLLTICHPESNSITNAGDWSPHRNTVEPKEWDLRPEITDELRAAFGEHDSTPRQHLSFRIQQEQCSHQSAILMPRFQDASFLQEKKQRAESRVRCVSNESLADVWGKHNEPADEMVPMTRQVSLELQMETEAVDFGAVVVQHDYRPKRRRNSSISEEMHDVISPMDEDSTATTRAGCNPSKRRRLHDRKRAMGNQEFGVILAQIGF